VFERLVPAQPQVAQKIALGGEAVVVVERQAILGIEQQLDGRADPAIALHRRIHRDQQALGRGGEVELRHEDAVEDRFAVFAFADLQIGCVR